MRHRSNRPHRTYAAIPNTALRDEKLSIEARGMLALLMTYSDDWTFNRDHLMKVAGIGRDKFQRIMRELMDAGYVRRQAVRGSEGKVAGSTWIIADDPNHRQPENPSLGEHRQPEKPTAGFSGPLRRSKEKKDHDLDLVDSQEEKKPPAKAAPFPETYEPSAADIAFGREKGWSASEVKAMVRRCAAWHSEHGHTFGDHSRCLQDWIARERSTPAAAGKRQRDGRQTALLKRPPEYGERRVAKNGKVYEYEGGAVGWIEVHE